VFTVFGLKPRFCSGRALTAFAMKMQRFCFRTVSS